MAHKEKSSIETLINEDRYFCSDSNLSPIQEISSWHFDNTLPEQQNFLKRSTIPSLPPLIRQKHSKNYSETRLNSTEFIGKMEPIKKEEELSPKNHSPIKLEKNPEPREKIKVTEFKSLVDPAQKLNQASNRNQFKPSVQPAKLKSCKNHKKNNLSYSESHKINIELSRIDYPVSHIQKEKEKEKDKKTKKAIGIAYPQSYYEKFFLNNTMIQSAKNQINTLTLDKTVKFSESKKYTLKSDRICDIFDKIQLHSLRSKSTLSHIFPNNEIIRNKYLLMPIIRHEI